MPFDGPKTYKDQRKSVGGGPGPFVVALYRGLCPSVYFYGLMIMMMMNQF